MPGLRRESSVPSCRSASSATATHHLAQLHSRWQSLGDGGVDDIVDPAFNQGEQGLEPRDRSALLLGVLGLQQAAAHELLKGLGIGHVDLAHRLREA